jgi:hypothetical protein
MAVSPAGSGNAADLTGGSPYTSGTVVNIQATPLDSYQFVKWTAPTGGFFDPNAPTTTFVMPTQEVTVTAHFVGPLDHFKCYLAPDVTGLPTMEEVYLEDEFGAVNATVWYADYFGNPAKKTYGENVTPIWNPDHHFTLYGIDYEEEPQEWLVEVDNQFGTQNLTVRGPFGLAVPTQKVAPVSHDSPICLDHFLLYEVIGGSSVNVTVGLSDEFGYDPEVSVYEPCLFANPVRKTHGGNVTNIMNPQAHLVFYSIAGDYFEKQVQVVNQFGPQALNVSGPYFLAVPSEKLSYEPIS